MTALLTDHNIQNLPDSQKREDLLMERGDRTAQAYLLTPGIPGASPLSIFPGLLLLPLSFGVG